jgi:hypothetical protein
MSRRPPGPIVPVDVVGVDTVCIEAVWVREICASSRRMDSRSDCADAVAGMIPIRIVTRIRLMIFLPVPDESTSRYLMIPLSADANSARFERLRPQAAVDAG